MSLFCVPDLFLYLCLLCWSMCSIWVQKSYIFYGILRLKMNNIRATTKWTKPKWTILGPHQLPVRAGPRACRRRHCCREKSDQVQVSKAGKIPFPFLGFSNQIFLTFSFLWIFFRMSIIFKPFRVGDKVGVGCISDSCMNCNSKSRAVISWWTATSNELQQCRAFISCMNCNSKLSFS